MPNPKVMVAIGNKASVEELVGLACQLANGMGAELIAFHVVQIPLATPIEVSDEVIDQEGKEILQEASKIADGKVSGGYSTQLLRARNAGEAIIAEAREQAIDLLVVGHRNQHELNELLLGSTMRHVAHHAPCKVIVQIPGPSVSKTQRQPANDSQPLARPFTACPEGITS